MKLSSNCGALYSWLSCVAKQALLATSGQYQTRLCRAMTSTSNSDQPGPAFPWCSIGTLFNGSLRIDRVAEGKSVDVHQNHVWYKEGDGTKLDLTVAADWMEFVERTEYRMKLPGGAGAYDTLRCDLVIGSSGPDKWRVWGRDYHLQRLRKSYMAIMSKSGVELSEVRVDKASEESIFLFDSLLKDAETVASLSMDGNHESTDWSDVPYKLIKFTWLWSPSMDNLSNELIVRGHACSSARTMQIYQSVEPIVVSVANDTQNGPSRQHDPQSKLASWTRERKELENPSAAKAPGTAEVLLTRALGPERQNFELLEGLSSNFFAIYKDGSLRTPADGVLHGYVRHLVLQSAAFCGLTISHEPICLSEHDQWQETFIASSSRLIYPIRQIMVRSKNGDGRWVSLWNDAALETDSGNDFGAAKQTPKWKELLDTVLRLGGYQKLC